MWKHLRGQNNAFLLLWWLQSWWRLLTCSLLSCWFIEGVEPSDSPLSSSPDVYAVCLVVYLTLLPHSFQCLRVKSQESITFFLVVLSIRSRPVYTVRECTMKAHWFELILSTLPKCYILDWTKLSLGGPSHLGHDNIRIVYFLWPQLYHWWPLPLGAIAIMQLSGN